MFMSRSFFTAAISVALVAGVCAWSYISRSRSASGAALPGAGYPAQQDASRQLIDGSEHPELIPDSIAYRLFFLLVAEPLDASEKDKARQRAFLEASGLEGDDLESAVNVLAEFEDEHDELVREYNASVKLANGAVGMQPDRSTFLERQDELVEVTRESLRRVLSPEGMAHLEAHVQSEKRKMKTTEVTQ